jgi:hypothetical protein
MYDFWFIPCGRVDLPTIDLVYRGFYAAQVRAATWRLRASAPEMHGKITRRVEARKTI